MLCKILSASAAVAFTVLPVAAQPVSKDGARVGDRIEGTIVVTDADTIRLIDDVGNRSVRVRLHGIDAPEIGQKCGTGLGTEYDCGRIAAEQVEKYWAGEWAVCDVLDVDEYGRAVARCDVEHVDLGAEIVRQGLALAYRKYSENYVEQEESARLADRGIFTGTVQRPDWHRVVRREGRIPPDPACPIKGNISKNGQIYHVPGGRWYEGTGIREDKGEQWFCTVEEAEKAGWTAAQGNPSDWRRAGS